MRTTGTLFGIALTAAAVIATPAGTAAAESPGETINQLKAQGYTVNVDRVGSARLEDCVVVSVRNPQTVTRLVRVYRNGGRHRGDDDGGHGGRSDRDYDLVEVVVSKSISVSLNCAL